MPANHTPNYFLSQWERSDQVRMEDFNADNAKLDGALTALAAADSAEAGARAALAAQVARCGNCQIYVIPYTGVGQEQPQSITFPDRPTLVFLMHGSHAFAPCAYGTGLSRTVGYSPDTSFSVSWSENTLSWAGYAMNTKNVGYQAIALCAKD